MPISGRITATAENAATNRPNSYISPYRFNVETYSIGGPVYIPNHVNRDRKKLFFFWSQEYTGQFVSGGTQNKYTPTALERGGDFSQSLQNNGSLIVITDPSTGAPFPGNKIPAARITPARAGYAQLLPLAQFRGHGFASQHRKLFRSRQRHSPAPQRRVTRG